LLHCLADTDHCRAIRRLVEIGLIRRDLTLAQRAKLISPAASLPRHRYGAA
jgi:hypothetical protein